MLSKELEIKYHIPINMDKIREIARYSVYIAIAGDKSLMLMRMAEGGSQPVYCEGVGSVYTNVDNRGHSQHSF